MSTRTWMGRLAGVGVALVAVLGAVFSYASLYTAASHQFGRTLAVAFPPLVDALIGACSVYYVGTVRKGRPQHGYRLTAHAGIGVTIALNALAAGSWHGAPWHVVAPAVWGVLVELRAKEAQWDYRAATGDRPERVPLRLWLTAPVPALRDWLWMARAGIGQHTAARAARGRYAAAREALRLTVPGHRGRRVRRAVARQLRAGSLAPGTLITATDLHLPLPGASAESAVLRAALLAALHSGQPATAAAAPVVADVADTRAATTPDTHAATTPDTGADAAPDTSATPIRPRRPRARTGRDTTAAAVARLRERHPDMGTAEIARRLRISDRTVRRHLANLAAA